MIRFTLYKARKNICATPRYAVNSTMKNNNIHNNYYHAFVSSSSTVSTNSILPFCNKNKNNNNKTLLFYKNQYQYYHQPQPFLFKVHNRTFVSATETKEDTEKGKKEKKKQTDEKGDSSNEEKPTNGGFFSNLFSEIKQELEKNEDLKKNLEQLSKIKDSTEKKANEYKPTEKNIEDATEAAKEAQKKLDEAAESAKKKSEDIYKKAEAAKDSFSKSWKNVTDTINEKAEKIEEDSESVREAKKKAFEAAENAKKKAEKLAGTSSFQSVSGTFKEIIKEGKDDLFGADKETRKERREKTKKMRERRAERRDARREKERLAKEAAIKKEQGDADDDSENEADNGVKAAEWAEAVDEDSGDTYYYNVKTGETTWDKPEGYGSDGEGTVDDENNNSMEEDDADNSDEGNNNETYIVIDETEAKAYFDGFDTEGTGRITEEQFDDLVDEIAERRPDITIPQTRIDVLGALEVMDPDAKGTVKLENYLRWIEAYTSSGGKSHGEQIGGGAIILRGDIETAWQRVGERLRKAPLIDDILGASEYAGRQFEETDVGKSTRRVRERVSNIREDALEVWETSQNPWVYRFASAYDGLTGETEQGQAIKELRRLDPAWDLLEWLEEVQDEIAPALLKGYLEGDNEIIDYYCVDQASALIKATVKDNKLAGKIPDPAILDLRGVELLASRVLQRAPPILVVKFNAQQLDCIRNNKGEVIEGSDDQVTNNFYYAAMQRNWDEEAEELRWHVLEFQIIGKLPWN
jgi:chemotaxis protein histidine kinase CheA